VNTASDEQKPESTSSGRRPVVIIAASVPPVQGQALVAQRVGRLISAAGHETHFVSRNPKQLKRGLRYYLALLAGLTRALKLSLALRRRGPKSVYVTSSGGLGVLAEGLCAALLLRREDRLVVHHHSFAYLNKPTTAFGLVSRSVYRRAHHIVLCEHMATLLEQFVASDRISIVSNAAFVDRPEGLRKLERVGSPGLRLGHLSNLSEEKGLDLALGVLADTPAEVSLSVYGTPIDKRSSAILQDALERFPNRLIHIEPTDRDSVWNFFRSIDLFLFPTRYRNEAAPLVVLEALAGGVPVVASDRGCIPSQLKPELGDFISPVDQFASEARSIVLAMLSDDGYRCDAVRRAQRQWVHLEQESTMHVSELLSLILADVE
jgi:glycosyltransferase involved in cell wall biosynthesis